MTTRTVASCIAVHLKFPQSVGSMSSLRYVYQQFQGLGNMVHWNDYMSKGGFSHHSSRSMAVFMIKEGDVKGKQTLLDTLNSIVGVPSQKDWALLEKEEISEVRPFFKTHSNDVSITHATLNDPFFRIVDPNIKTNQVRLDKERCLPMVIEVQELT